MDDKAKQKQNKKAGLRTQDDLELLKMILDERPELKRKVENLLKDRLEKTQNSQVTAKNEKRA